MKSRDFTRRQFLLSTGLGLSASMMASAARGDVQTTATAESPAPGTDRKLGWAIAGIGNFARGPILNNIVNCKHSKVAGFVTRDPEGKGQEFAKKYNVDPAAVVNLENMHKLADRDDIDVVYVITPNSLHKDYTLAALKAGKHVFCEKPFAPTEADCQEMVDAAKQAGKLIGLGYRVQFDPANIFAIETIREEGLGRLKIITGEFGFNLNTDNPPGAWRAKMDLAGGGSLADIGVYGINAARFLTGEEPIEISGHTHSTEGDERFTEVEETAMFRLTFPSGVQFHGTSSYGIVGLNRVRAMGQSGWIDLEPAISYEGAEATMRNREGVRKVEIEQANQFVRMMDDFSLAVMENRPARSTGEDGLLDVRYINAVYESARNNSTAIKL